MDHIIFSFQKSYHLSSDGYDCLLCHFPGAVYFLTV